MTPQYAFHFLVSEQIYVRFHKHACFTCRGDDLMREPSSPRLPCLHSLYI